jgi:glutamate-1-semialdehyde 2,1-aminomutase
MSNYSESAKLFEKAKTLMPGGVNSPVRAFNSVDGEPIFIKKGKGAKIWDEDGNEYIDFCGSWGPLILGHCNEKVENSIIDSVKQGPSFGAPTVAENSLAQLIIDNHRFLEKIRFTSSGTEAVMSALRLARGITGKSKILKFDGCYHGHVDSLLVNAGSGLATLGTGSSAGIPDSFAKETVVAPLNDLDALHEAFKTYASELAAVIIEPIPANNGLLVQNESYLKELRKLCTAHDVLLIFDEVISGFRVGFEGAAGLYNIEPDLMTYGKIIGGGMPVGAYGGKTEYMDMVAPVGPVYQAGTLSGNPVAMSAGWAQINQCLADGFYENQKERTDYFAGLINQHSDENGLPIKLITVGSIFWMHYNNGSTIQKASEIKPEKNNWFQKCHRKIMDAGVYFGPSAYEVGFVSAAHDKETLKQAAEIVNTILLAHFK